MIKQGTEANRYVADGDLDGWVGILRVCSRGSWVIGGPEVVLQLGVSTSMS